MLPFLRKREGDEVREGKERGAEIPLRFMREDVHGKGEHGSLLLEGLSGHIRRMLSMLMKGTTIRQACHQSKVSLRTGVLYLRKFQALISPGSHHFMGWNGWADETYASAPMKEQKPGKGVSVLTGRKKVWFSLAQSGSMKSISLYQKKMK
jgi:hypothetical protein